MSELLNTSLHSSVKAFEKNLIDEQKTIRDAQIAAAPMVSATTRTTDEIKELHETIRLQIESTNKQSKVITRLTGC
jgi:Mg2+ and Co2+ transporter CorA